jgi:retron-type reverse transcriptase
MIRRVNTSITSMTQWLRKLNALCVGIERKKVNWILDADIRSFFDEISQEWLIRFLEHRIGDPRIIRLILKWLKAGILEDGIVNVSDRGTGQGTVISPLLANVYLHYVLDLWAERCVAEIEQIIQLHCCRPFSEEGTIRAQAGPWLTSTAAARTISCR